MKGKGTILAVEDERASLKILTFLLDAEGYEVVPVGSGEEALATVAKHPPDLILLDIGLPDINGFEVFRQLKTRDESRDIPVIFLSAYTETAMRLAGLKLGAVDFISKPYHREELIARVGTHLELFRARGRIALQAAELQRANEQLQRDIVEREQAEAERHALETRLQLARKLESVGRFAAGIAHEINTPTQFLSDNTQFLIQSFQGLARVFAAARRLRTHAAGWPDLGVDAAALAEAEESAELDYLLGEIPRALEQSRDGLNRIGRIVGSLKEFAHPSSAEKCPADLNHALEIVLQISSHEWKYVADAVTDFDLTLPPVPCILDEFNQAILNLIINAAEAVGVAAKQRGGAKGRIALRTRHEPAFAVVEIEDNGTGIPALVREKMFEPFVSTKGPGRNLGQGLAIVRNVIVIRHGGAIEFTTEENRGTTFRLRLPLAPPPAMDPTPATRSAANQLSS